jgi:hypothetical protein
MDTDGQLGGHGRAVGIETIPGAFTRMYYTMYVKQIEEIARNQSTQTVISYRLAYGPYPKGWTPRQATSRGWDTNLAARQIPDGLTSAVI